MSVSRGAGSAGVLSRAAFWQSMLTALLALVLAGCGGDGVSLRAGQVVQVSGDVVAQDGAAAYHITAFDQQGNRLGTWSTAADGHFQQALRGQSPFRLEAVSPDNDVPLAMLCEGQPVARCDITPWSTLIYQVADATGDSPQDVAATLYTASFFGLAEGEDPFLLRRAGELDPLAFDADAVLALMATAEGLGDWLASMTDWLTGVSGATAPPGVPRVTVTAQASAGGSVTPASQTLLRGETAVFAVQAAAGHHITQIDGCDGSHDAQAGTFTTHALTAPCVLTVTFEINQYPLTYTPGENGSLTGAASQTVAHGADASAVTAVPDTGYHFVQWSDGSVANPRQDLALSAALSVTATFAINQYALAYSASVGGSLGGQPGQQVSHGSDGSAVTAIPDTGYHFVQWSDLNVQNPRTDLAVTQDLSVQAQFARNAYSLHYSAGAGGSLTGLASQSVLYGDDGSAVSAQPDVGYHFVQWSDGSTVNPRTDTDITASVSVTAGFAINQYSVSYSAGPGGSVDGEASQTIEHGSDAASVTAVADTGYHFVQWSDGSTSNPRSEAAVTGDLSLTAQFALNQYSLTYIAGANGSLTGNAAQTVSHGDESSAVQAVPDIGYRFVQWSDGSTANPRTDSGVTADLSVTAQFTLRQYSVLYTSQGNGTLQGQASQTVDHGADGAAITAVPDAGYDFAYWSDGGTANPRTDVNVTADIALSAAFSLRHYALNYATVVGGSVTGDTAQEVGHGSDGAAVTATPDTGYHFVQWSDGSTANPRTDTSVTADISVLAIFALDEFALTYTAGAGGSLNGTASQAVVYGSDGTAVEAVPDTGYYFTGWSDGGLANPRTDTDVMADLSVQASFALYQYTLSYAAGTGGSLSGSASQTVDHGSNGTAVQAVPDAGYQFVQWSDGSTANPRTDSGITADLSVTAQFTLQQYSVVYTSQGNGTLQGQASQTVNHGEDGTAVTAVPDAGYDFAYWSDGGFINPRTDVNVTADIAVSAAFSLRQYALTYGPGAGGSVTGDIAQEVGHGSDGTAVTATPDTGYHFVQWSDGSTANPRTDTSVTADISVLAVFALDEFTLTYTAGTGGSLNGTASQAVVYGGDGTAVEAVPDTGYYFASWSDGGLANPRTDTNVMADLSVQASFTLYQYTLSYTAGTGGSLSGSASQTVDHGSDGTAVQAVPDTGYHFVQWSDGSTANPRTESSATGDLSVQAQFAINEYSLTYTAGTGGSLSGSASQTVAHGNDGSAVSAVADSGYQFEQWSDGSVANPRTDTGITADLAVTAQFVANALELAVDEKYFAPMQSETLALRNTAESTAEYLLVPMNLTPSAGTVAVSVALLDGTDTPSVGMLGGVAADGLLNLREPQKTDALARLGTAGAGTPLPIGAGIVSGVPTVGDFWQMNVNLTDTCDNAVLRNAEVKLVGTHVIILEDVDNPPGGFVIDGDPSDADYMSIANEFDNAVYPSVTALLGDLPDRDGNGRVILFYTRAMNEMDPPASAGVVPVGRYMVRDRLSRSECPAGNVGEVIYMKSPDPTGVVNSNVRSASSIKGQSGIVSAMEMALMIADHRQLLDGGSLPDTWLEKGLAGLATASVFYQGTNGLAPLHRITLSDLTTGANASRRVAAFNTYQNLLFGDLRTWMQAPWRAGILSSSEKDLRSRGFAWAFLRYASDRLAIDSNNPPMVSVANGVAYQLAGTSLGGWDSLVNAVGPDAGDWLRDFVLTVYLEMLAPVSVPGYQSVRPYRSDSWDFRSVFGGLGGNPLHSVPLPTGYGMGANLEGGGGAYYVRFAIPAGGSADLLMQAAPQPGQDVRYALVRLK